jgi:hypothetical protein
MVLWRPLREPASERDVRGPDLVHRHEHVVGSHVGRLDQAPVQVGQQRLLELVRAALDECDLDYQQVARVCEIQERVRVDEMVVLVSWISWKRSCSGISRVAISDVCTASAIARFFSGRWPLRMWIFASGMSFLLVRGDAALPLLSEPVDPRPRLVAPPAGTPGTA